ncbi:Uncharacterized protein M6B38_244720 [Iris pallida]|uniref:BSD domain-containing protein n=1 Tax=Iris pallida TaxID=29817 RepID=A0AAX6DI13_IRIPA|nr:Uncharacterized protein M6B38_244720 [Iris pallida]
MSWLARSFVSTLRGDEEEEDNNSRRHETTRHEEEEEEEEEEEARGGVKEDLSELTQTLARQFWGVASFLAPPPSSSSSDAPPPSDRDPSATGGIRSDLADIGGRFRSGISMLSNAKAVSEISKIASSFLPFGDDEEDDEEEEEEEEVDEIGAVGVTEDVVAFARSISLHPETWLGFPLAPDDEDDSNAFDMSDAQQEHALAVERLAPSLAELRVELCPSHMSERHFWKIYFVLLHSRLNKHDADLLSTPQIMQARAMLLQDLPRAKQNSEGSGRGVSPSYKNEEVPSVPPPEGSVISPPDNLSEISPTKTAKHEESTSFPIAKLETDKYPVETTEVTVVDKSVIEENPPVQAETRDIHSDVSSAVPIQKCDEDGDGDDWLEEEHGEAGAVGGDTIPLANDEDVSFSDLEDDEDEGEQQVSKTRLEGLPSAQRI